MRGCPDYVVWMEAVWTKRMNSAPGKKKVLFVLAVQQGGRDTNSDISGKHKYQKNRKDSFLFCFL